MKKVIYSFMVIVSTCFLMSNTTIKTSYDSARYYMKTNPDKALSIIEANYSINIHDSLIAKTEFLKGYIYYNKKDFYKSSKSYYTAITLFNSLGNKKRELEVRTNIGGNSYDLGLYEQAVEHFLICINIAKEIDDKEELAQVQRLLGRSYRQLGKYNEAAVNLLAALEYYQTEKNTLKASIVSNELGLNFMKAKLFDEARNQFHYSVGIVENTPYHLRRSAISKHNIGMLDLLLGDTTSSWQNLKSAEDIFLRIDNTDYYLVNLYEDMMNINNNESTDYAKKLVGIADSANLVHMPPYIQALYILSVSSSTYKDLLINHIMRINHERDSLITLNSEFIMQELQLQASIKSKINITLNESRNYKTLILVLSAFLVALFLFVFIYYRKRKIIKNQLLKNLPMISVM